MSLFTSRLRSLLMLWLLVGLAPARAQRIAASDYYTLSIRPDGSLWAWGLYTNLQLGPGTGSTFYQPTPARVGTATNWQSVAAGGTYGVAIRTDGTLWTWGINAFGQLGTNAAQEDLPAQVGTATNWKSVASGGNYTVALRTDGTLWAWGYNGSGQLGNGSTAISQTTPMQVGTATTWQSVTAGAAGATLAIRTDGTLWAWGSNHYGQLGLGNTTDQLIPVQVGTATTWKRVSAGVVQTIALRQDGTLWAWGTYAKPNLGSGPTPFPSTLQTTPVQVGTATTWQRIATGGYHSLAVRTDGSLWTWGDNTYGQLGLGTGTTGQPTPVQAGAGAAWQEVAGGKNHSVALRPDGSLWTWGYNAFGQIGDGSGLQSTPSPVAYSGTWRSAVAGGYHSVALRPDGSLWTWGANWNGQLGTGTPDTYQGTPQQVGTATTWQQLSAGIGHTLALRTDGTLWAWGWNLFGQIGNNTLLNQSLPQQIGTASWQSIAAGNTHSVAIRTDGSLWAWGSNRDGELGTGTTVGSLIPVQIGTATTWQSVAAGLRHTVALRADGTLWAWGNNDFGQLGIGSRTSRTTPMQVGTATTWQSVTAGEYFTLARRTDGTLWVWGTNDYYAPLGGGTTALTTPVQIGAATTWQGISGGRHTAAAVRFDGTLWTWGNGFYGALGNGILATQRVPGQVGTGSTWQSVTAGADHMLALQANGTLWAWGLNSDGQLGHAPVTPLPTYIATGGALATGSARPTPLALHVYPNPTAGGSTVSYQLPTATTVRAEVFDAAGRRVLVLAADGPQAAGAQTLAVPALPAGLYTIRLLLQGGTDLHCQLVAQ